MAYKRRDDHFSDRRRRKVCAFCADQSRTHRLQGGQPPPPLPLGARQDRAAPQDGHLRPAPARAGRGPEAGPPRRPAALRAAAHAPVAASRRRASRPPGACALGTPRAGVYTRGHADPEAAHHRRLAPTRTRTRKGARPQDDTVCWFEGQWTRLADAKVSIMTHSFLYGTAVFEGIRAYWNADDEQLYLLKARQHFERIVDSSKILHDGPGLQRRRDGGPHLRAPASATATARTATSGPRSTSRTRPSASSCTTCSHA